MDRGRDAVARQTRELSTTLKPIRCPPVDDLTPAEIAPLLEERGVAKATASISTTFVLGVPAGAVIALGAVVSALVATESPLGYAPASVVGSRVLARPTEVTRNR
ncbi:MAG: hypothetical protein ACXWXS_03130 [Actinomycetota bacterium]